MARKLCSACKRINAGSATACTSCGHAFDPSSVVAASRPKLKRCPTCGMIDPALLETCACGHVFEDVREAREYLQSRVHTGWLYIGLGLLGIAGCTALMLATSGGFVLLWTGGIAVIARGMVMRSHAHAQLDKIQIRRVEPPKARLLR